MDTLESKGTISEAYLQQQQILHRNPHYGVASLAFAPLVATVLLSSGIDVISDYGAGKKNLLKALQKQDVSLSGYLPYDPVFPDYGDPRPAPLVCCIDVLEHVEPSRLDTVLRDLAKIVVKLGFFTIHTGPACKVLEDGRNAHLIQAPSSWWLARIAAYFEVEHLETHDLMGPGLWMLVSPRREPILLDKS